jgi:L-iditol 2-dehydrogenase
MKKKMLQQIMPAPKEITFKEVDVPTIQPSQVLIKIKRIGICGSDIHVYHGKHPYVSYPLTQGHEVSGKIVEIGNQVKGFHLGQKVTIEPQVYCGECYPCTHGKYNLCENLKVMGFQTVGTASEYVAVDATKVTSLPDTLSYEEGAMIEPLAVTVHACKRFGDVKNKNVAVMGTGPIGILLCQTLKAFGASKIMATDISDYRLSLAKDCGVDYAINTKNSSFGEALEECFGKDKADVIFDCAGNDITMNQAIQNARKGSDIILVAVFADMANVDLAKLNDSELKLNTSMMYRHEDYLEAIQIVENGSVKLEPLISKHYSFQEYALAYEYIDANYEKTMKIIIDVDSDEKEN